MRFEDLLAEGTSAVVDGWDFSWFAGRATEERPLWGYSRQLPARLAQASSVLDVQTGGGEVLADILARTVGLRADLSATEGWPPNAALARRNLEPYGVAIVDVEDYAALPFPDGRFDLVISRHPTIVLWKEIARVLRPGGTYLSQQVGAGSVRELTDFMMGPQPVSQLRSVSRAVADAEAAGLAVVDLREEAPRMEFFDIAAVIVFLRKVIWTVPNFDVDGYRGRLFDLHRHIEAHGPFVAHAQRRLIEVRKS